MAEVSIDSQSPEDKIVATIRTAKFEAERCLRSLALDTADERPAYVYALFRPDGTIRYVGKGTRQRIHDHGKFGVNHYNKRLAADYEQYGKLPARKIISSLTDAEAFAVEIHLIAYWGIEADGVGILANGDYGGGGGAELSEEARAKITQHNRKVWADPSEWKRRSDGMRASWTDERRASASKIAKDRWKDPEMVARRDAANKATWAKLPELRENLSKAKKAMWRDPEMAARITEKRKVTLATPESKAKRSAITKDQWDNGDRRDKVSKKNKEIWADPVRNAARVEASREAWSDPARCAKISAANKAAWSDPAKREKKLAALRDPEQRAKHSAFMKELWAKRRAAKQSPK